MKYILIGGSGFIGQHFKNILREKIILNLDIDSGINNSEFRNCNILKKEELNAVDLSEIKEVSVIHLAAVHFDFQKKYFETNIDGTKNILEFIDKWDCIKKYVFFSSVATYGESEIELNEKNIQNPYNDYGKSKLEAEKIIFNWHSQNKINVIIVRPAVVFGEYNFGNVFNLITQIQSGVFAIIGDGKNIKSLAYAPNLVDSVIYVLNHIKKPLFIYNYSDYPQKGISDQSELISKLLKKRKPIRIPLFLTKIITIPIDFFEIILRKDLKINSMRVKKFTIQTFFNSDLIRNKGFIQKYSLENALTRTIKWIKNNDVKNLRKIWYEKASKL